MTTPLGSFSAPRQPGESRWDYTKRRTLEIYGVTPWRLRIQRGTARGLTPRQAAGREPVPETLRLFPRAVAPEPVPEPIPEPPYGGNLDFLEPTPYEWLEARGYTPETTGLTRSQLVRIAFRLKWILEHSSPGVRITPEMIKQATDMEATGQLAPGWAYERIRQKYLDMRAMRDARDNTSGADSWREGQEVREEIPELPAAWWMYR